MLTLCQTAWNTRLW